MPFGEAQTTRYAPGHEPEPWKGALAGAVAGAAGAFVMETFQTKLLPKLQEAFSRGDGGQSGGQEGGQGGGQEEKPATVKAADAVAEKVFHTELSERQETWGSEAVHYAQGATSGAIYGVAAEYAPVVTTGWGLPFGVAVWAIADEAVVPALGLSKRPTEYPVKTHAYALASHLVYGFTTAMVHRGVRRALDGRGAAGG